MHSRGGPYSRGLSEDVSVDLVCGQDRDGLPPGVYFQPKRKLQRVGVILSEPTLLQSVTWYSVLGGLLGWGKPVRN